MLVEKTLLGSSAFVLPPGASSTIEVDGRLAPGGVASLPRAACQAASPAKAKSRTFTYDVRIDFTFLNSDVPISWSASFRRVPLLVQREGWIAIPGSSDVGAPGTLVGSIRFRHQASLVGGARQHARTPSRGRKPAPGALFRVFARPPAKAPRRGHAFAAATSCFAPFLGRLSKRLLGRLSKRLLGRLSKRLLGRLSQRLLGRLSRGFRQRGGRPRQHVLSRGDRVAHVRGRGSRGPVAKRRLVSARDACAPKLG
jgi:hypothetical protein